MKTIPVLLAIGSALFLSSCGLVNTATQVPKGLLQSVGRTVGIGLQESESTPLQEK